MTRSRFKPITQHFNPAMFPVMVGFSLGLAQQLNGPLYLVVGLGHRVWRWKLREAKINLEGEGK